MRGEVSFLTSREAEDQKHHLVNIYNREENTLILVLFYGHLAGSGRRVREYQWRVPKGSL